MPDHGDNQETPAPVTAPGRPRSNRDWWPNQPDLRMLRQPAPQSSPLDGGHSYREQSKTLDVEALKRDVIAVMTSPQDWWAADYGHYGPLFIRMTWHAAGTYRIRDGRGGEGGRPALRTPQQLAGQREPG